MSYTTLWEVPDGLWERIEQILPCEKRKGSVGRPALPNRQVVNGILFVLPVERTEEGMVWRQQQPAQTISDLEPSRVVEKDLSRAGEVLS